MRALLLWLPFGAAVRSFSDKADTGVDVCTPAAVQTCESIVLDEFNESSLSAAKVSEVTSSHPDALAELLQQIGLGAARDISCSELCQAATAASRSLAGSALTAPGSACLDSACAETLDVSDDALRAAGLWAPTGAGEDGFIKDLPQPNKSGKGKAPSTSKTGGPTAEAASQGGGAREPPDAVLRRVLAVFFVIFPAPDAAEQATMPSPGAVSSLAEVTKSEGEPVAYGPRVPHERYGDLRAAAVRGAAWAASAARRLPKANARHALQEWMGRVDDYTREHVRTMLNRVVDVLGNAMIKQGADEHCEVQQIDIFGWHIPAGGTLAYVWNFAGVGQRSLTGRFVIHVCELLWDLTKGDSKQLTGTLVHEATHHYGTVDTCYGRVSCKRLAQSQPEEALNTADNYQYLVTELVNAWGPSDAIQQKKAWTPHPVCTTQCGISRLDGVALKLPASECGACKWKRRSGLGGKSCGDGTSDLKLKVGSTCFAHGCEALESADDCAVAAKELGIRAQVTVQNVAVDWLMGGSPSPGGCFAQGIGKRGEALFFSSQAENQEYGFKRGDAVLCVCPRPFKLAQGTLQKACCTVHPCSPAAGS
eukprot:gb/GFBE01007871.1/.p1 GENE.gb/GFBE01007871.1/~~gb/GFBE01007871.1/.p1  ORF type:complete len:593 (+),score=99.79 gb/GFBE01007871.1/:1-1779(+)